MVAVFFGLPTPGYYKKEVCKMDKIKFENTVWYELGHFRNGKDEVIKTGPLYRNTVVETGAEFLLDLMFTLDTYGTGGITHEALGDSNATNDGLAGPSAGSPIPEETGTWQGVDPDDWRLSNEVTRVAINTVERTDQSVLVTAVFDNALFPTGGSQIREVGLFLSDTPPNVNPQYDGNERPNSMFSRALFVTASGGFYHDSYEQKDNDGLDMKVYYRMEVLQ